MLRLFHFFVLIVVLTIAGYFFAGNPIEETYLPIKNGVPNTEPTTPQELPLKNGPDISETISKISEAISEIKNQITEIPNVVPPPPTLSPEEINTVTRTALVNIYCTTTLSGGTHLTTGSGVIIDPRGIVLTNAHVADSFLFEGAPGFGDTDCIIRGGSPATPFYDAKILYLSPSWARENSGAVRQENPVGTGEHDFALLLITRSIRNDALLPDTFPFLAPEFDRDNIKDGDPVLLASYPAGFLGSIAVQKDLYQVSTIASIAELFTFQDGSVDLFSIIGNIVAQKGSSGSGVVSLRTGKVLGIVVTSSEGATTADRELQAIVFAHMSESMKKDIGFTLKQFLAGDPAVEATSFAKNISPALLQILSQ